MAELTTVYSLPLTALALLLSLWVSIGSLTVEPVASLPTIIQPIAPVLRTLNISNRLSEHSIFIYFKLQIKINCHINKN